MKIRSTLLLILITAAWGLTFPLIQKRGLEIPPFTSAWACFFTASHLSRDLYLIGNGPLRKTSSARTRWGQDLFSGSAFSSDMHFRLLESNSQQPQGQDSLPGLR